MKFYGNVRKWIVIVTVFLFGIVVAEPLIGPFRTFNEHLQDVTNMFGSSPEMKEIFTMVSTFMDNEAKADFRKLFPEAGKGLSGVDHRVMGHVLDGGYIRKDAINAIMKKCPGLKKEEVIRRLVNYNKKSLAELVEKVVKNYGIPAREAKALIRINACTHLLGDTSTSLKTIGQIPTAKRIVTIYEKNLGKLIGKKPAAQLAKQLRKIIADAKKEGLDNKELYKLLKNAIVKSDVGEKLQKSLTKLKESVSKGGASDLVVKSKFWETIKGKLPSGLLSKLGKSKIAKSIAKWCKRVGKNPMLKKTGKVLAKLKPVTKVLPYVIETVDWGHDMYSITEEYKSGEISSSEKNKKLTKATGKWAGALAGFAAGWKLVCGNGNNMGTGNENDPAAALKVVGGLLAGTGMAIAGAWGAETGAGAGYDAIMGTPFGQVLRDATNGNTEAIFFLGKYYDEGRYVNRNFKKAVEMWKIASSQGHSRAAYELGRCYMMGKGVEANHSKAVEFFWKSYIGSYASAAVSLARAYYEGVGVPQSICTAISILKQADNDWKTSEAREYAEELLVNASDEHNEGAYQNKRVVAEFFYAGFIVEMDKELAKSLLEEASEAGDILATCRLGDIAVEQGDEELAQLCYLDAADDGCFEAQIKLAYLIEKSADPDDECAVDELLCEASDSVWDAFGQIQDDTDGVIGWLIRRAEAGCLYSNIVLSRMLLCGVGMPLSVDMAKSRLATVANKGCVVADRRYARLLMMDGDNDGIEDARKRFSGLIDMGDSQSKYWHAVTCLQSGRKDEGCKELQDYVADESNKEDYIEYSWACRIVGNAMLLGKDVPANATEGERLLLMSAGLGDPIAKFLLGHRYLYGVGLDKDIETGVGYLHAAADGNVKSLYHLGICYNDGIGVEKDIDSAINYYRLAAELGSSDAQYAYAELIKDTNNKEAMMWCENAAEKNNLSACHFMGDYYMKAEEDETHTGFKQRAFYYYSKGAELHDFPCLIGKGNCLASGAGCQKNNILAERCFREARMVYSKEITEHYVNEINNEQLSLESFITKEFGKLADSSKYYVRPRVDTKKLKKAMKAMNVNEIGGEDRIWVQYDSTFFGGAKEGFLLSPLGIYFSNGVSLFCAWNDIQKVEVTDKYHIHIVGHCRHTKTGERYRGGYIDILGGTDDGMEGQYVATILEVAVAMKGGCSWGVQQSLNEVTTVDGSRKSLNEVTTIDGSRKKDMVSGEEWYRADAEKGNPEAQYYLGVCLEGTDKTEAVRWYRKSAEQGNANARYALERLGTDSDTIVTDLVTERRNTEAWQTKEQGEAMHGGKSNTHISVSGGVKLLSMGKTVTSSDPEPIIGDLTLVTDGDKEPTAATVVELGPKVQWVQIDLGSEHEIHACCVWHYYNYYAASRTYRDVICQISNDPDFIDGVVTVFNNDHNNSAKLGKGKDKEYIETREGCSFAVNGVNGRYVRFYSNGNSENEMNHYTEVEVYGK